MCCVYSEDSLAERGMLDGQSFLWSSCTCNHDRDVCRILAYTFVGEMLLSNQIFVTQSGMGGGGNGVAVGC